MKTFKILSAFIFSIIFGLIAISSVSAEVYNRVVAIVNNNVITLHDLNIKILKITGVPPDDLKKQDMKKYIEASRQVLNLMIDEKLAGDKIKELGIKVLPNEVDSAIERIKKNNNLTDEELNINLKKQGFTHESYRDKIKGDLERNQLISFEVKSKIIIEEKEIKEYYEVHKDDFTRKEKVRLAAIILTRKNPSKQADAIPLRQEAEEIITRLQKGEDFSKLANEFSQNPGTENNGDLGFFISTQLDPEILNAIKGLSEGGISEPIIRPSAIKIIKVLEKQEGKVKPLTEVRDAINETLFREKINNQYDSWIKNLRETAYTKILL